MYQIIKCDVTDTRDKFGGGRLSIYVAQTKKMHFIVIIYDYKHKM